MPFLQRHRLTPEDAAIKAKAEAKAKKAKSEKKRQRRIDHAK